jgi:hypothetical protein
MCLLSSFVSLNVILRSFQVFGKIDVECASYIVLKTVVEGIELRRYASCVAVETPCARMDGRDGAFGRLASYIG